MNLDLVIETQCIQILYDVVGCCFTVIHCHGYYLLRMSICSNPQSVSVMKSVLKSQGKARATC